MKLPFKPTRFHSQNFLPLFVLVSITLQFLLLLLLLFQGVKVNALANQPAPSLVQMVNGKTLKVAATDPEYRSPEVLKRLVKQWATMTFNWSGQLPSGKTDPGVKINDDLKVPTAAWAASFTMSEDFRTGFLKGLAQYIPQGIFEERKKTVLQFEPPSLEPVEIEQGKWKLSFVANLLVFEGGNALGNAMPVNKTVYLRTVPQPQFPLEKGASEVQKAVYSMRDSGLQIYKVEEFKE